MLKRILFGMLLVIPAAQATAAESLPTLTNQDAAALYAKYLEAWKAVPDATRAKIANDVISSKVQYATPRHQSGGRDTMIADAASFQEKFPGGHFEIGDVSAHHNVALLTWVLIKPDGTEFARGHDMIEVGADGKLARVTTFAPPAKP